VGEVPRLRGCDSRGRTMDELLVNRREVVELCLEDQGGVVADSITEDAG
jgi:predicted RNase H-like HicB family nuclease